MLPIMDWLILRQTMEWNCALYSFCGPNNPQLLCSRAMLGNHQRLFRLVFTCHLRNGARFKWFRLRGRYAKHSQQLPDLLGTLSITLVLHVPMVPTACPGFYWSSTVYSVNPMYSVWIQHFDSSGSNYQQDIFKLFLIGVRCSRALTI